MKKRRWWALLALVLMIFVRKTCGTDELTIATFNIEDYPKSRIQEVGALAMIAGLRASAVAVQEITRPDIFAARARETLGENWRFVYPESGPTHRIGVLFDSSAFRLLGTRVHRETERAGGKAAFEARLEPSEGGDVLRLIVLHLKAGGENIDTRQAQLKALAPVLVAARRSGDRVVVLGDFNATSNRDRDTIESVASQADLEWASEDLGCTSYWDRRDGCVGSALDHVLVMGDAKTKALGPCEIEGCSRHDRCPIFVDQISDHCPVTIELR